MGENSRNNTKKRGLTVELKETTKQVLKIFKCETVEELPEAIIKQLTVDSEKILTEYTDLIKEDNTTDWLQAIYQFNLSDRENLSQDYTPPTISKLCSHLLMKDKPQKILDICSGSGSLTLGCINNNCGEEYFLQELDERVIPFCLVNLALKNVNGLLINTDVVTGEVKAQYRLTKSKKFSKIEKGQWFYDLNNMDACISNPPFNLRLEDVVMEFEDYPNVKGNNLNYGFIYTCLQHLKDDGKAAVILPNGVLTSEPEKTYRRYLVDNNLLEAVIMLPDKMFESTSIPVTVLLLNKGKTDDGVVFINVKDKFDILERKMKGELHMANRVYTKQIKGLSDFQIEKITETIEKQVNEPEYSYKATLKEIQEKDYLLSANRYIQRIEKPNTHRPFKDIVEDLTRIINRRNEVKLTVNEKVLKTNLSKEDQEWFLNMQKWSKECNNLTDGINDSFKMLAEKNKEFKEIKQLPKGNWFTISKKKNMVKFENNTKSDSTRADMLFHFSNWKSLVYLLNEEENRLLAELRDALMMDFFSQKIEI